MLKTRQIRNIHSEVLIDLFRSLICMLSVTVIWQCKVSAYFPLDSRHQCILTRFPFFRAHEYAIYIWLRLFSAPKTRTTFACWKLKWKQSRYGWLLTLQLAISEVKLTSNWGDRAMHVDSRANSVRTRDIKYMDWKRFRNLRVPENHPCCAYMDSEWVSLLLTRTNMTWMLIPVDGFQGCSSKFSDLLYG